MIGFLRALLRIIFFALGSFFVIGRYVIKSLFIGNDIDRALRIRKQWFSLINKALNVSIEIYGDEPTEPGLLLCNHRSYYDPIIVLSQILALPVGKAEVANWPVIGLGARVSGAIFIERKSKEGRKRARKEILDTVLKGYSVINYPEGTTHTNPQTIDFKPGMFEDAASHGISVYPIVHEYQLNRDAWINEDTFLRHFFECFAKKETKIRLSYGPKLTSNSSEELLELTKLWIDNELTRLRKGWHESSDSIDDKPLI